MRISLFLRSNVSGLDMTLDCLSSRLQKELLPGIGLSRAFYGSQDPSSRGAKPLLQKGPSKDPQGSVRRPLLSGLRIKRVGLGPFSLCGGRSHNGLSNW